MSFAIIKKKLLGGAVNNYVLRQSEHYGAARMAHPQPRQRRAELCFGKAAAPADS